MPDNPNDEMSVVEAFKSGLEHVDKVSKYTTFDQIRELQDSLNPSPDQLKAYRDAVNPPDLLSTMKENKATIGLPILCLALAGFGIGYFSGKTISEETFSYIAKELTNHMTQCKE